MSGGYSDFGEALLQNFAWGISAGAFPANPWISLHTANPAENGASEVAGGSYVRQQISPSLTNGVITNLALLRWDLLPAVTVTHFGAWDAVTVGNIISMGALDGLRRFFCAVASTDDFESNSHGLIADDRVEFESPPNGSLPMPIVAGTLYFVITAGLTANTFRVSLTSEGAAVNLTTDGTGSVIKVTPKVIQAGDSLEIAASALTHTLD